MRHLKADVSHRMRRRPSIFSAWWFRILLGGGAIIVLMLAVGPSLLTGLRRIPSARIAVPSPGPIGPLTKRPALDAPRPEPPATFRPAGPGAVASTPAPAPLAANGAIVAKAEPAAPPAPAAPPTASTPASAPAFPPAVNPDPAPAVTPVPEPAKPKAPRPEAAVDGAAAGVYRVQVGAFLDHRNADRLVARLRSESFEVVDSVTEQSRVLYRVLAAPRSGEAFDGLLAELKRLGFHPEMKGDSAIVTGPVPLKDAVETSRALRDRGLRVRLERQTSSGSFRVVRVGEFGSADEAERTRAELARRGIEGIVVREK